MLGNAATRVGSEGSRRAHHMHGWALDGGCGRLHGRRRARRVVFPSCALETRNPPRSPSSTLWEGTRRGRAAAWWEDSQCRRRRTRSGGQPNNSFSNSGSPIFDFLLSCWPKGRQNQTNECPLTMQADLGSVFQSTDITRSRVFLL